jgi:hypothetical protein
MAARALNPGAISADPTALLPNVNAMAMGSPVCPPSPLRAPYCGAPAALRGGVYYRPLATGGCVCPIWHNARPPNITLTQFPDPYPHIPPG